MKSFESKLTMLTFGAAVFFAGIIVGSDSAEARASRNLVMDDQPDGLLMVTLNSGAERFSFLQISDPHVGAGFDDYGNPGYDDAPPPAGDVGTGARYLRKAVDWMNENHGDYGFEFVVVNGDITDSAERSEFLKAREILDTLDIPYIPLPGNHDIWPYTEYEEAPYGCGDEYFMETFESVFSDLAETFGNWDDGTRLTETWNPEVGYYCYFQNFSFDHEEFHFICADFNTREHAIFPFPGIMPEADLHVFKGGTGPWCRRDLMNCFHGDDNIYILAHHPLSKGIPGFAFSAGEYSMVTRCLNNYKNSIGLWAAGHIHYNRNYNIKHGLWSTVCPGEETGSYEPMDENEGENYGDVINREFNGKLFKCLRD